MRRKEMRLTYNNILHESDNPMKTTSRTKTDSSPQKAAFLTAAFLILVCMASLTSLLLPAGDKTEYTADIFQNGILIMSIPLAEETESRTFTVEGDNGCVNEIEIRPGSIGIISADCPDKLCVGQGFISDTRLPITCLPNRLVIQLRPVSSGDEDTAAPDIITY